MAAARRKIRPEDIHGLKYFKALQGLIERLHFVGTQRDKAGNRNLHMDQYCSLIILWFDQLPDVSAGRFDVVGQTLTAVDGSVVETLARVARLSWLPKTKGRWLCSAAPKHRSLPIIRCGS